VEMVCCIKEVVGGGLSAVIGSFHLGSASRRRVECIVADSRDLRVWKKAPCRCRGDRGGRPCPARAVGEFQL
jgi:metal-dependent hydrolase (beta-lactamase superfamily II)